MILIKNMEEIYLNMALYINKKIYDEVNISFNIYKLSEEEILKRLNHGSI